MKVMVIVKATRASEAGQMPSEQLLSDMGKFNEELVKAGIMLAGEGLHRVEQAGVVRFSGKGRAVIDRPLRRDQGAHRRLLAVESVIAAGGIGLGQRRPNPH